MKRDFKKHVANSEIPNRLYNTRYTTISKFGGGTGTGSLLLAGAGGAIGDCMLGSIFVQYRM